MPKGTRNKPANSMEARARIGQIRRDSRGVAGKDYATGWVSRREPVVDEEMNRIYWGMQSADTKTRGSRPRKSGNTTTNTQSWNPLQKSKR